MKISFPIGDKRLEYLRGALRHGFRQPVLLFRGSLIIIEQS